MSFLIPDGPLEILSRLSQSGYRSYLVGGCVRDLLLGAQPDDWDVATNAAPGQVQRCFADFPVLETGLRHGTVTVLSRGRPYEVTTFRSEGAYSDGRRPDKVIFVQELRDDLARRDFTINAMAWNPHEGLIDCFGGRRDLRDGHIACVGDPRRRFGEDALRILRAIRFSAVLGFSVEPRTEAAMTELAGQLARIARERIRTELDKMLLGAYAGRTLRRYGPVLQSVLPGFDGAAAEAVDRAPRDLPTRLAVLLAVCCGGAGELLSSLRYDNRTTRCVERLLSWSGETLEASPAGVRRWLNRLDREDFFRLLDLRWATGDLAEDARLEIRQAACRVLERGECCRLRDMAVTGSDLLELGVAPGSRVGEILNRLLGEVIDGGLSNERGELLRRAGELRKM